jgi:hypothetical protein
MPTKFIVAGIDGTGSHEWRRVDGANSHVYRFLADVVNDARGNGGNTGREANPNGYFHGPGTTGLSMGPILIEVTHWILDQMERLMRSDGCTQRECKIAIAGHSRGASAAIGVANRLASNDMGFFARRTAVTAPVQVEYVGLYDTVDRSLFTGQDVSMPNVTACRHARRRNRSWNGSRWSFGTVDTGPRFPAHDFDTAHGGIGGDPGYFTRLGGVASDYYCNALELILTQEELTRQYGYVSVRGVPLHPRYSPLSGLAAQRRRAFLLGSIRNVQAADTYIRNGAISAGFRLPNVTPLKQYGEGEDHLWQRLTAAGRS